MRNITFRLRALEPEDALELAICDNNSEDWWTGDMTAPYSYRQLREYAENYGADPFKEGQLRLIAENNKGEFIGIADFYDISARHRRCFTGIYIKPECRGKGYGKELLKAMKEYNLNFLGLETLAARIASDNQRAEHIYHSQGFVKSGVLPHWHHSGNKWYDISIFVYSVSSR